MLIDSAIAAETSFSNSVITAWTSFAQAASAESASLPEVEVELPELRQGAAAPAGGEDQGDQEQRDEGGLAHGAEP